MSKQKLCLKQLWLSYTLKTETSHTNHDQTHAVTLEHIFISFILIVILNKKRDKTDLQVCSTLPLEENLKSNPESILCKD